ncbi:MAG: thiamine pyrophosphate-dependent enzyme [Solirubrobacterales bacterium]
MIVAGRSERNPHVPAAIMRLAGSLRAPVLADTLSGARAAPRRSPTTTRSCASRRSRARTRPDVVVRVGDLPTSKPLRAWLAGLDAEQVALASDAVWADPDGVVGAILPGDPAATLTGAADARIPARPTRSPPPHRAVAGPRGAADPIAAAAAEPVAGARGPGAADPIARFGRAGGRRADPGWLASWRAADAAAAGAIDATIGAGALNEPLVARTVAGALGPGATLFVASSMPVRELETFAAVRDDGPRVLCNRGANGIDGTIASALGVAATGAPTTLLIGDVALAYDHSALLAVSRLGLDLTVVVVDNGGGGIFDFLAVSGETDAYEHHVATPTGLAAERIAALYGLEHVPVATAADLRAQLGRPGARLLHARTDRAGNVELHRRVWAAVAAAL